MAPSSSDKQTAGHESPHDWLMSLAMNLVALCDILYGGENGTYGSHFPVFSEDVAFARHVVATHPSPILPPCRSVSGIDYANKITI